MITTSYSAMFGFASEVRSKRSSSSIAALRSRR
jgi:hypothetical protein